MFFVLGYSGKIIFTSHPSNVKKREERQVIIIFNSDVIKLFYKLMNINTDFFFSDRLTLVCIDQCPSNNILNRYGLNYLRALRLGKWSSA